VVVGGAHVPLVEVQELRQADLTRSLATA